MLISTSVFHFGFMVCNLLIKNICVSGPTSSTSNLSLFSTWHGSGLPWSCSPQSMGKTREYSRILRRLGSSDIFLYLSHSVWHRKSAPWFRPNSLLIWVAEGEDVEEVLKANRTKQIWLQNSYFQTIRSKRLGTKCFALCSPHTVMCSCPWAVSWHTFIARDSQTRMATVPCSHKSN